MIKTVTLLVISILSLAGYANQPTTDVNKTEIGEITKIKKELVSKSTETITITDEIEIAYAELAFSIFKKTTGNASKCQELGENRVDCMCNEDELNEELKQVVTKALNKYPQWEGNAVYYSRTIQGKVHKRFISIAAVENRLEKISNECN